LISISGVLQAARLSIDRYPFESRMGQELILDIQGVCGTLRFRPEKNLFRIVIVPTPWARWDAARKPQRL
jgi:hypothetical protein